MLPLCWKGKQGICRGRALEGSLRLDFTALLVSAALLVLTVPVAHASPAARRPWRSLEWRAPVAIS
jgi:hypothetical protein